MSLNIKQGTYCNSHMTTTYMLKIKEYFFVVNYNDKKFRMMKAKVKI